MAYYYINGFHFEDSKKKIKKLTGYLTDRGHNNFFPPQEFPRVKVIEMIKTGSTFFVEDGNRKIIIKIHQFQDEEYLRVDNLPLPSDYFG